MSLRYPNELKNPISGINVVSFSGGRTSAFLVYLMEQERLSGMDVHYVFMDTGAEHPKTYEFVRNIVKIWGVPLTCIRMVALPMNKGVSYKVIDIDDISCDLAPFREMMKKYGAPDASRPHCSNKMKENPFKKYCNDKFGRGNYTTWLGIRFDEMHRIHGMPGIRYLAEISGYGKQGILNWWLKQPFDLGIDEHLGNCVFCVKKSDGKLALARKDEPELFFQFLELVTGPNVRTEGLKDPERSKKMYRGYRTLEEMGALFPEMPRDELFNKLKMARAYDTGSCSESCEVFKLGFD